MNFRRRSASRVPEELDVSFVEVDQTGDRVHRGRLARTVGAEQAQPLAGM